MTPPVGPPGPPTPAGFASSGSASGSHSRRQTVRWPDWWRRHRGQLALVVAALLPPSWAFATLATRVRAGGSFAFDLPILDFARALGSPALDRFFVAMSQLGYLYGVVPFDIALVMFLLLRRQWRVAAFATLALAGSGLLNVLTKQVFARDRPALWESIAPETTWSFPSGHAMGSATLAVVLILLAWHTRWRWPVIVAMAAFVLLVGFSRVYLGVHYPSDILAGWAVASVWTAASFLAVFRGRYRLRQRG
ncbi:phosphatase PAP2 family protein [Lysobacter sp. CW239]|uniref:phosphatase PAP2 family protein n=1 Tax=Novilysobacter concretionis TaxID=262325 RepID=UPI0012EC22EE|nr:phosphatase PAP2 family protein [Lysobacter sp. CW239]